MRKTPLIVSVRSEGRFSSFLRDRGVEVISVELTRSEPLEDQSVLQERLGRISEYDGLFVTSPQAASVLSREVEKSGVRFEGRVFVLGARARRILSNSGLNLVFSESATTAKDLIDYLGEDDLKDGRFLFVRGNLSMNTIPRLLAAKAELDEVSVYRTGFVEPDQIMRDRVRYLLDSGQVDSVCFFSPSAVASFGRAFGKGSKGVRAAVIGGTTAAAAADAGFMVEFVAEHPSAERFASGLLEYIKNSEY